MTRISSAWAVGLGLGLPPLLCCRQTASRIAVQPFVVALWFQSAHMSCLSARNLLHFIKQCAEPMTHRRRLKVKIIDNVCCGRPWPATYININVNTHQIQVLTEPLRCAQAILYSLPNNEWGTKYRGLSYSAKLTVREICRATYSARQARLLISRRGRLFGLLLR